MKFVDVIKEEKCTGCMACKNACPRNAIEIVEGKDGFLYPKINKEHCTNCSICRIVCPVERKLKENQNEIEVYACKNKDSKIRSISTSGGIFTLLSNYILDKNGVVFGAAYNENLEVVHEWTDNKKEIEKFRSSKYLQSKIEDSYKKVKEFLEEGRKVLFTGTPCQIEGLKAFLRKDYENLYTQDFICHGVPSPKVWRKYLKYKKETEKENIKNVNFRNKNINGWSSYYVSFYFSSKEENTHHTEEPYMKLFLKDFDLRRTCYNCNFKKEKRVSDVTVADFWGIDNVRPEINDDKGISVLLINSSKGKEIFENIKQYMDYTKESIDDVKKYNYSFVNSVSYNEKREEFFEDLDKKDFSELINKYL